MSHCHSITDSGTIFGRGKLLEEIHRSRFATVCGNFHPPTEMKIRPFHDPLLLAREQ